MLCLGILITEANGLEKSAPIGAPKKIYIFTAWWGPMFAIDDPVANRDNCLDVYYRLREVAAQNGYALEQITSLSSLDECEHLVVFDIFPEHLAKIDQIPKEKRILFLFEPPSTLPTNDRVDLHEYFSKIYTWNDQLVDNKKYFKFYYPVLLPMIDNPIEFDSKKLCCLISCNKFSSHSNELYSERQKVIRFFETFAPDQFDLYGRSWSSADYPSYCGGVDRKADCMKWYKFSFAYENIRDIPGYVTEKIFDCFQAGSVPIYWGASNVDVYIPKNCFIAREDFESDAALYEYLVNMTEQEHTRYLDNIRAFLSSEQAQLFSPENFIRIFMDLITTKP